MRPASAQTLSEMPTEQQKQRACVGWNKSWFWWGEKMQPTAFSVLKRFWSPNQNLFSPRNGREISSSVYGQTRHGQLYLFENIFPKQFDSFCTVSQCNKNAESIFVIGSCVWKQMSSKSTVTLSSIEIKVVFSPSQLFCRLWNFKTYPKMIKKILDDSEQLYTNGYLVTIRTFFVSCQSISKAVCSFSENSGVLEAPLTLKLKSNIHSKIAAKPVSQVFAKFF